MKRAPLLFGSAAATLFADVFSKWLAFRHLPDGVLTGPRSPVVDGWLWWTPTPNPDGAFSFLQHISYGNHILTAASAILIPLLIWMAARPYRGGPMWAFGLLLGGAVGNLIDRIQYAAVLDFIDLGWWPVFNVADMGITVGVVALSVWSLFFATRHREDSAKEER